METGVTEKLPYPKSVFFIYANEFFERYSYYATRTIYILFLTNMLLYHEADAKIIYHLLKTVVYFAPIIGGIISDSWLGKFKTIFYVSLIYAAGSILLSLTAIKTLQIPQSAFSILGVFLISSGAGAIKPCVPAFGGDQFQLPQQEHELTRFFSFFYFAIGSGSLLAMIVTPILRNNVKCFEEDNCFPLAFGVGAVAITVSIIILLLGKATYKITKPKSNLVVSVCSCVWYAIRNKGNKRVDHWLDRAEPKYSKKFINDIKILLKIVILYLPTPIFWALYDQQSSGWTFQAVRMNGETGFFTILPDQMQVLNPVLILAFIPLFTYGIYPALNKIHLIKTQLQRMCVGFFLIAVAFTASTILAFSLEATFPILPDSGEAQLRVYDPTNCNYSITFNGFNTTVNKYYKNQSIAAGPDEKIVEFSFSSSNNCPSTSFSLPMKEKKTYGISLTKGNATSFVDNIEKSHDGYPLMRVLSYNKDPVKITYSKSNSITVQPSEMKLRRLSSLGNYSVNGSGDDITVKMGGTYTLLLLENGSKDLIVVTKPNTIHILWLLPQHMLLAAAEVMFAVTGIEFSYSQAPVSMKTVLQAVFLITTAFGNILIVIVEAMKLFVRPSTNFLFYTILMLAHVPIFIWLAVKYQYTEAEAEEKEEEEEELNEKV